MAINKTIFQNGSSWVRADFHLHTKADVEFQYTGDNNYYFTNYVAKLKEQDTRVGVITNHNKFDFEEFKALRKTAANEGIYLVPGVELSVGEGASGVHVLIVFSETWLENSNDYINPFIQSMFSDKIPSDYQNENGRSDKGLIQMVEELDKRGKEYFLIFAHVEDAKGLWKEMSSRLTDWDKPSHDPIRQRTLGFQKVRTHDKACSGAPDRTKVKKILGTFYPAEVEGSDPKSIDDIGNKKCECYVKIGDFTFEALTFALSDYANRVAREIPKYKHSRIQNIIFEGGLLNGETIQFSPELNTLIGIRGSGKSAIVEAIRYVLDIPFGENSPDQEYKTNLIKYALSSGGKITLNAVDKHGQAFKISRILGNLPEVYIGDKLQSIGILIRETILSNPIYFGQKDLSSRGEGFEKGLVEKLVGDKLRDIRRRIELKREQIRDDVANFKKLSNVDEQKKEYEAKKQDAEFRLKVFKEYGLESKLQRRVGYNSDYSKLKQALTKISSFLADGDSLLSQHEDDLRNMIHYDPKQDKEFWVSFFSAYNIFLGNFDAMKHALQQAHNAEHVLKQKKVDFENILHGLQEDFAEIERKLAEELTQQDAPSIRPDDFVKQQQVVITAIQMVEELGKAQNKRLEIEKNLKDHISELSNLHHEEFKFIESELEKINCSSEVLKIKAFFKGDKVACLDYLAGMFRGSKIRTATFENMVEQYSDFAQMYLDWENTKKIAGSNPDVFEKYFFDNLADLLIWQVPNNFLIEYRGKELKQHSLGQRASALILFVLSQHENDVIIIDQPEDDLDNQTIYEDVIKLIVKMKSNIQFVFATHNANIPVLGDADQVHSCSFTSNKIYLTSGSIDNPAIQHKIVDIMEGGEDAFNKRKEIYRIWNPQK